ncbi:hypothetical protein SPRG_03788 [Saprolegnia parasitica CBS 223.65]|uniref:BZIP domain-containing protein n=1 Tax=Saprolegnia parasitica (strain CBS 223.65) TaxID=695850 RepID=A0A067CMY9_SAPPC|nr:hypothetical protein SPRG_03788 [Saprolegnia parasitica CBS 223.65]KDO31868.1 hypothetical protein SPRG_03788 [Saprolegnia parasitica CBS 223.65]|eukprot:XP_012197746.1 hypothetical protein SPRG_03788 [Saprolegnia parasitica CBS 223.65]
MERGQGGKRHAPKGQWKTPPQMLYMKEKANASKPVVPEPASSAFGDENTVTPQQFAEGTQGLTLDTTLLAKMTGKDASQIGAEQIRNIMQHPELLSIYQKLQEEEERRQRRLERNRASARLRREKKKGLVETYEMEVSELETILKKVKSHKFGCGNDKLLLEALSGEQKQSVNMTRDTKHQQTSLLLKQHSQNASAIRQANDESWMVALAATNDAEFLQLKHTLGLTEAQCARLARVKNSVHNESTRLAIVEKCFAALHVHEWLHFPNSEGLVDLFRAPLNAQQLQKFVQWTRVNKQAIQQLQFVQPPADPKAESSLVFDFPREL